MSRDNVSSLLLRGSAVAFALTATAQGLAYLLQVMLARTIGPVEFGFFSYAMAWLSIGLIFGKLGYDTGVVRFVGQYLDRNEFPALVGVIRHARRMTSMASTCVALSGAAWVILVRADLARELSLALLVTALLLPLAVYSEITAAAVRGLGLVGPALAGDGIVRPLLVIAAVGGLAASGAGSITAVHALVAYILGTLASIVLTGTVLARRKPSAAGQMDLATRSIWSAAALPLMVANGFLVALYAVDTLMIGWLADTTAAGYYSVASKLALLVLFAMNSAQLVAAPMLSGAAASFRREEIERIVNLVNKLSVMAALPIGLGVAIFALPLLRVFGPDFEQAAGCLKILATMQIVNVLTGPSGLLLSMTGHQRLLVALLAIGLSVNVALNFVLIPAMGATGAALSAFVAHTCWNLLAVAGVRMRLGIDCSIVALLRARRSSAG